MNMRYARTAFAMMAALLLAACSNDDTPMDPDRLPEGMYPLEIASVSLTADVDERPWGTKAPQTRVTENTGGTGSVWQEGDKIKVQIGNGTPGTYTYQNGGTLTVADGDRPAYWTSTENGQTIKAWYTSSGGETVDLSDQTNGLAYIVMAQTTADFNTAVQLSFSHALAKVRVYLKGTAYKGSNDIGITLSYPASCTVADGNVTSSGTNSTIQMHKVDNHYEALVPPGTIAASGNPFKVSLDNGSTVTVSLFEPLELAASNKYDVTLRIHTSGTTEVDLSKQTSVNTISGNGIYYFYNSENTGNYGIKVTGGSPNIYIEDAKINAASGNAIDITGGNPTIHVLGNNNNVTSSNGAGIYVAQSSSVTITGRSREDVLTARGGNGGNGIGGYTTMSGYTATSTNSGNISVSNVTVYAYGSDCNIETYAPGIGGAGTASCGTITIDNATVYAYGTGESYYNITGAAIGGGIDCNDKGSYSTITIRNNSEVYVQRGNYLSDYIGHSGSRDNQATATNGIDATVDGTSKITKLN